MIVLSRFRLTPVHSSVWCDGGADCTCRSCLWSPHWWWTIFPLFTLCVSSHSPSIRVTLVLTAQRERDRCEVLSSAGTDDQRDWRRNTWEDNHSYNSQIKSRQFYWYNTLHNLNCFKVAIQKKKKNIQVLISENTCHHRVFLFETS